MKVFCGKCHSRAFEERPGEYYCRTCGNVTPSQQGFEREDGTRIDRPLVIKNKEVITKHPESKPREESNMASKKGTCGNCARPDLNLISGGHCFTCWRAAKGKSGDERAKALQDIKERIQSGKKMQARKTTHGEKTKSNHESDHNGLMSAYDFYVKSCEESGGEPLSKEKYISAIRLDKNDYLNINTGLVRSTPAMHAAEFHIKIFCADRELFSIPFRVEVA